MELDKHIDRLQQCKTQLHQGIQKDIERIVDTLLVDFDIYTRGTDELAKKENIKQKLLDLFQFNKRPLMCVGVTKMGHPCTKKRTDGSDYCKAHFYKQLLDSKQSSNTPIYMIDDTTKTRQTDKTFSLDSVEQKMIDDSMYYIDSQYIYDIDSFNKVGYIHDGQYVLTDDPFVLGM